jgi:pectate lyase
MSRIRLPEAGPLLSVCLVLGLAPACAPAQQGGEAKHSGEAKYAAPVAKASPLVNWPKPTEDRAVEATIKVNGTFDGGMARFYGTGALGTSDQDESQDPIFKLSDGAVLKNVIIGDPSADGVHCKGSCRLENVWWENVGEDAATFRGQTPSDTMVIDGGGASGARDKVFQDNGFGTMYIKNFYVEWFGKLFRSCGNCTKQMDRHVVLENVTAVASKHTATILGLNQTYNDTAEFRGKNVIYDLKGGVPICLMFEANNTGAEPKSLGAAADGESCKNLSSNVVVRTELEKSPNQVAAADAPASGSRTSGSPALSSAASPTDGSVVAGAGAR